MSEVNFTKFYRVSDFVSLVTASINEGLLRTALSGLTLSTPIGNVEALAPGLGARLQWDTLPSAADITSIDGVIAAFTGGATTSEPFEIESLGTTQSTSGALVDKINFTTPPLDAGTYQVCWCSSLRMNPAAANAGVLGTLRVTRSDAVFREQSDAWDLTANHAFNGAITFKVLTGQTLTVRHSVSRIGASGTAEMFGVRVTIDQLSAG